MLFFRFFRFCRWCRLYLGRLFKRLRRCVRFLCVCIRFFRRRCRFRLFLWLLGFRCRCRFYPGGFLGSFQRRVWLFTVCRFIRRLFGCFALFANLAFGQQLSGRRAFALVTKTKLLCFSFAHVVDERGDFRFLCKFACLAAAVARDDLKLAVLALAQDNRLLHTFEDDAACQRFETFLARRCEDAAGQVMDFGKRNVDRFPFLLCGVAGFFFCHVLPPNDFLYQKIRLTVRPIFCEDHAAPGRHRKSPSSSTRCRARSQDRL